MTVPPSLGPSPAAVRAVFRRVAARLGRGLPDHAARQWIRRLERRPSVPSLCRRIDWDGFEHLDRVMAARGLLLLDPAGPWPAATLAIDLFHAPVDLERPPADAPWSDHALAGVRRGRLVDADAPRAAEGHRATWAEDVAFGAASSSVRIRARPAEEGRRLLVEIRPLAAPASA
ncbi:MAG: hypothetical protein AAGN46_08525 [Acidobacteriota bacterium]